MRDLLNVNLLISRLINQKPQLLSEILFNVGAYSTSLQYKKVFLVCALNSTLKLYSKNSRNQVVSAKILTQLWPRKKYIINAPLLAQNKQTSIVCITWEVCHLHRRQNSLLLIYAQNAPHRQEYNKLQRYHFCRCRWHKQNHQMCMVSNKFFDHLFFLTIGLNLYK